MRRSIVAARDLPEGTVLQASDLDYVRPGTGLPPTRSDALVGRKAYVRIDVCQSTNESREYGQDLITF